MKESGVRAKKARKRHCSLSDSSPTDSVTTQQRGLPCPGEYLRLCPFLQNRCTKTKKYGPNERTDENSKNRSDEEIANLSDAQFKTLVIRTLTEMVEDGCKKKRKK